MRVIGGYLKGRALVFKKDKALRPTKNVVREAIFNILGDLSGKKILDMFTGTGALGIEGLSRGADVAVFVENSPGSLEILRRNVDSLGLGEQSRILPVSAKAALDKFLRDGEKFDVVLADPPYSYNQADFERLFENLGQCVTKEGRLIVEVSETTRLQKNIGPWHLTKEKRYGSTKLGIYSL